MTPSTPQNILLHGVIGSTAHGLAREGSDVDTLGVFVAPTVEIAGLDWHSSRESIVQHEPDVSWHEVGKFLRLALKSNPSILEILNLDEYLYTSAEGRSLIALREYLLHPDDVKNAFGGYADQQMSLLLRTNDPRRFYKAARHVRRLIEQGTALLTTGTYSIRVADPEAYFAQERADREGVITFLALQLAAFDEIDTNNTPLTKYDRGIARDWLRSIREAHVL